MKVIDFRLLVSSLSACLFVVSAFQPYRSAGQGSQTQVKVSVIVIDAPARQRSHRFGAREPTGDEDRFSVDGINRPGRYRCGGRTYVLDHIGEGHFWNAAET